MIGLRTLTALGLTALLAYAPPALAAEPAAAIVHGRLLTITHGIIEDGVLVMAGGRIVAVGGPGTRIPTGARIYDARGKTVYPGLFDTEDTLGLVEGDSFTPATATKEPADTPTPWALIADAIHPTDWIDVERLNGITNAVVSAGASGPLPGHSALIQLLDDKQDMLIDRDIGLVINFEGRRPDAYPTTVFGIVGYTRQLLSRARQLAATGAAPGPDDAAAAAFIPYLGGKRTIIAHVTNDTEVSDALNLAQEFGLKLVLCGLMDVDTSIDRIAASKTPVVVGMLMDPPRDGRRYDYDFRLPARLAARGIPVAISTFGAMPGGVRNLPYEAGVTVPFGFTHEQAMQAITLAPAEVFGMADRLGSLDAGKVANVVISTGDPLDVQTDVIQVFIQGQPVSMTSRQTRLRDQYMAKQSRSGAPTAAGGR
jgi:imidazolonepropionase-like amidohydrolase